MPNCTRCNHFVNTSAWVELCSICENETAATRAFKALNESTSARINTLNQALLQIERLAKEGTPEGNVIRQAIAQIARKAVAGAALEQPVLVPPRDNEQRLEALRQARAAGATIERKDWAANRWCFAWAPIGGYVICGDANDYRIVADAEGQWVPGTARSLKAAG